MSKDSKEQGEETGQSDVVTLRPWCWRILGIGVQTLLGSRNGGPGSGDGAHLRSCHGNGGEAEQEQGPSRWAVGEAVMLAAPLHRLEARGWPQWITGNQEFHCGEWAADI